MGKSKPRHRQRDRQDPTSKPTKPPADPELAAIREQQILPVLKGLTSSELQTRSNAANAIANLIGDAKSRKLLLREHIVKILFEQTLTDSSLETRASGWGILRNLALEEEADFCIHLFRQDVLTAIEGTLQTVIQTVEAQDPPFSKLPHPQQRLVWNLTTSLINLITSLAEAQDEIVEAISKLSTVSNFLFGLLAFDLTPLGPQNDVLSCLTALTEDNKPLVEQIINRRGWVASIVQIKDTKSTTAIMACGALHNIFSTMGWSDHNKTTETASDAALLPAVIHYMDVSIASANGVNNHTSGSTPDQILQLALEITASIATSLQEALERGEEKEFQGFDEAPLELEDMDAKKEANDAHSDEDGDQDYEMNDDEIQADMDFVTGDGLENEGDSSDEPTLEQLVREAAPRVLALLHSPRSSNSDAVRDAALSALNNIAWTVSSIDFSMDHLGSLRKFWSSLAQEVWDKTVSPVLASNTADIELASSITSLAWAVSRSVQGTIKLQPEEARKFMALYQASRSIGSVAEAPSSGPKAPSTGNSDEFQGLGVKCIGVLGSLARSPAPIQLNREIGVFLLTTLAALPDTPAADTVEILNQVFDIYADKRFAFDEPVFWGDGFHKHLEDVLPKARKMAKGIDKRKFEELRARADEAILNLGRFLKYKKRENEDSGS
ncbi:hypothetical protein BJ875DRAFT_7571 [Amylocarpus encephaloides]|uniref:SYO1-like TPR repeats domain-containing protein n=1 Tax=Amylocarpus encephaloides TaxID=45428 RepID=A0A9P7YJB5_9HELO|nr:hypothetical protein BJ875DRAFT_7571 [Amylocarpus encephaloides]